ncbi:MAG: glucose-1-phosphate cytidylyltransferase [Chloroflexi bacterium]|nr:glucose-1-phosphate cytidylyltransferase [Chloroflexota bacterium]
MKVGILAGGYGTRLAEETDRIPKPMVEIGDQPILWHIMKGYAACGFDEFVIALGYKRAVIKDYFLAYRCRASSLTIRLKTGEVLVRDGDSEDWTVHLLDTGLGTQTGGRIRRVAQFVGNETMMITYGDAVADLDIRELLAFHQSHGRLATVTIVRPTARFGGVSLNGDLVARFEEKPQTGEGWVNGGFFVLEPKVLDYIDGDDTVFERGPLERLAEDGQLVAYRHPGFWQCMDTLRDLRLLEALWESGKAPWKVW